MPEDNDARLRKIAESEGFDSVQTMLEAAATDSVCPGICTTCGWVMSATEPDQDQGWCENCDTNTVESALVLAGLI
jgi:hypothetical protein